MAGAVQCRIAWLKGAPGILLPSWEMTTSSFVLGNNLVWPPASSHQKQDSNKASKLATFLCHEWKEINKSNSTDKYCSEHNITEKGYLWPLLCSQYKCENKTLTLFKFKVPYRQSSNETAKPHIAKICLSFMLPKRQPLPFVSSLSSIKASTGEQPYPSTLL